MKRISRRTRILIAVFAASCLTGLFFTNCAESAFKAAEPDKSGVDPFLEMAWHISNTAQKVFASEAGEAGNDLNLLQTWESGLSGNGISILISDDGVEDIHEDLKKNFLTSGSKDYTLSSPWTSSAAAPKTADDNHGTAVAGLIAAVASNGVGTKGVAFKAGIASANFLSSLAPYSDAVLVSQADGNFDLFNMSWGASQNVLNTPSANFQAKLKSKATTGRSGKGSLIVKAAGNDFFVKCRGSSTQYCVGNANFDSDNSTPYTIIVSALNAQGYAASYSSPGSNIWISSFGGEFGDDSPAMVTTDRTGCSKGFSASNVTSDVPFERGANGNSACSYSVTFNGTSAATPVLTGAIALILEANPALTWRDVKYILAKTAVPVNYITTGSIPQPLGDSIPSGYAWEQTWIENAAGFKFHNWYGFGKVDVDAAVAMAKNYVSPFGAFTETGWAHSSGAVTIGVPDNSSAGGTSVIIVNDNLKIESVQIQAWVTHADVSELALELISPSTKKSILVNMRNSLSGLGNFQGEVFLTNAFYQEQTQGAWTLKVVDGKSGNTGTLTQWKINFTGSY
ncbi:S8 family serine peptidase [Bdellovibrio sp. ArHS]|uniref:S8 family serine peptidase n=1 Tax=Bdellovibrio sp. ArHS TaxID=1569284 RepID=UPI000A730FAD|nr:S8 family serine peptidase [Bdellovibrio sp. ArHS]